MTQQGLTEDFYQHVGDAHGHDYSEQEKLAIEYAERFVLDHTRIDDELFGRLQTAFSDPEILDLTICVAAFLGLGRLLRVLGIDETCEVDVRSPGREDSPTPGSPGPAS